jgi:type II secretory ATPase GspE/PulE/Tfp pilus assembly ATPase PilB-like protein
MQRRFFLLLLTAIPVLLFAGELAAQQTSLPLVSQSSTAEYVKANPGGYLSWIKLICVIVVFILWVRCADWVNRDSMKIGQMTEMPPEVWNPINVGSLFIGLLIVLFVPLFAVGYPIFAIAAFVPPLVYFMMRRSAVKAEPRILEQARAKPGQAVAASVLPQDEGANVEFTPTGEKEQKQIKLIRARQSSGFLALKELIADALFKRADLILLDFTRDRVNGRLQVDGAWHAIPPMTREIGDAVLVSIKNLAGANPAQRKARQVGEFSIKTMDDKADVEMVSQGVPTGERTQLKFKRKTKTVMPLNQLGMFPDMIDRLKTSLNQPGLAIVSAPPGQGLTTSWRGTLVTADRLTRDCVALIDEAETETVVENIVIHRYDPKAGKKQFDIGKGMLLSQPDLIIVPKVEDPETMDLLTAQVATQDRSILLRAQAKSAAEALLKTFAQCSDRDTFANAVKHVTCQRLVRRLCDACKQEARVAPKMIQQLGGDPRKQKTLYNQYRLPPPEQRVDDKGNPIEIPPCDVCGGIGYIGRIGVFEMLEVDDSIRAAMRKTPKAAVIEQVAQKSGKKSLTSQAYQLVLLGVTSLAEVQRVLKE